MEKTAFILALFLVFGTQLEGLAQSPKICKKHLIVNENTQENWAPGIVKNNGDSEGGKIYRVKIKVKKSGYVTFKKLIIQDEVFDVETTHKNVRNAQGPFKKGDEVILIARSEKNKEQEKVSKEISYKLKDNKANSAIVYSFKDKEYLQVLPPFAEKQAGKLIQ